MVVLTPNPAINATYLLIDALKSNRSRYFHPQSMTSVQAGSRQLLYLADPKRTAEELLVRVAHPEVSDAWDELDTSPTWHTSPSIPPLPSQLRRRRLLRMRAP
jgi:hypothetical protein